MFPDSATVYTPDPTTGAFTVAATTGLRGRLAVVTITTDMGGERAGWQRDHPGGRRGEGRMKMTLVGLDDAVKQMERIARMTKAIGDWQGTVGSRAPYAYGIEIGSHRVSGKLARRAGGAGYLRGAVDEVMGQADADIAEGMKKVTAPGPWVIRRLARWARRVARVDVPRTSGRLRRTIRADVRKG